MRKRITVPHTTLARTNNSVIDKIPLTNLMSNGKDLFNAEMLQDMTKFNHEWQIQKSKDISFGNTTNKFGPRILESKYRATIENQTLITRLPNQTWFQHFVSTLKFSRL